MNSTSLARNLKSTLNSWLMERLATRYFDGEDRYSEPKMYSSLSILD